MKGVRQASSIELKTVLDEFVDKHMRKPPRFICRKCWLGYGNVGDCVICNGRIVLKGQEYDLILRSYELARVREGKG